MSEPSAPTSDPNAAGPALPWPSRLPQRLRRQLAALSLVGAALVALPVLQLLRYQSAELDALAASRAGLDPVARTVQLQRGLLAHRDITAHVLRGLDALEPERLLRQAEVDRKMAALTVALASGGWEQATGEADAQREDWLRLARQVLGRTIDAPASNQAHRLLIEQGLQIIDLLAEADPARSERSGRLDPTIEATMGAAHSLPRLAWQTSALAEALDPADAGARQRQMVAIEAALARTLGRLERAPGKAATGAGAAAGAAAERYFALLRNPQAARAETGAAAAQAVLAQWQLFDAALAAADATLDRHSSAAQQRRTALAAALALLGAVAALLLLAMARGLGRLQRIEQQRSDSAAEPSGRPAGGHAEASQLMQRLRDADPPHAESAQPAQAKLEQAAQPPPV